MKKYRLAIVTSHPIQYQIPFFRKLAAHPAIDLTVYFSWDFGIRKPEFDAGFGQKIQWDVPLLEGYHYKFLKNLSWKPSTASLWGQVNPGILPELLRNRYDAVWVQGYRFLTDWFAFFAAKLSGTPIFFRGESNLLNQSKDWKKLLIKKATVGNLFKIISAFLSIGTLNREYYLSYKVPPERIFLLPFSVDGEFFERERGRWSTRVAETRAEIGATKDTVVILYSGKIYGDKGPGALDLLKAFEKLGPNPGAALLFVGDGKDKPTLEAYVQEHKLSHVAFVGFKNQTELSRYYSITNIMVLPSHTETWGLVVNELMYFGAAIIASDRVGSAYDLVRDGVNGYRFPVGDINALRHCLERLIKNPTLRATMGTASREIIGTWGLDEIVEGALKALEQFGRHRQS